MAIPHRADRDEIEHYRVSVESFLNRLTQEAEDWAESGKRKSNEHAIRRLRRKQLFLPGIDADALDSTKAILPILSQRAGHRRELSSKRRAS
jgi:hypothetical protein